MNIKLLLSFFLSTTLLTSTCVADEGMWLPIHIKRLNEVDMQNSGLQLSAEEIYSINNSSLKDAIVQLGNGCTAEVISREALLLTNHHCAYGIIQANSTPEHDYLTDGFWAYSKDQEIPAEGLKVSFLVRMEDVTKQVLSVVSDEMDETTRAKKIAVITDSLEEQSVKDTHYNARIKSFFNGNEYYLFVYETFTDIRLVGAPPSSIGKFGGDTDNWMWPRHTGDFSLLRVYADKDNKPAEYSTDNVPYKPKHYLPISIDGVEKDDFAMIMGYPGSTSRYLTSFGVKNAIEKKYPATVKIRAERLGIIKEDMDISDDIRIKYASKYAQISNYYKNYQGQIKALTALNVVEQKENLEAKYNKWANESGERKMHYGDALTLIESGYDLLNNYTLEQVYLREAILGSEILKFSYYALALSDLLENNDPNSSTVTNTAAKTKSRLIPNYKDYNADTDKKVTAKLLELYYNDIPKENHPKAFSDAVSKSKNDFNVLAEKIFASSNFSSQEKAENFLNTPSTKTLSKDMGVQLIQSFMDIYNAKFKNEIDSANEMINRGMRVFVAGQRKMNPNKKFYPNANFTMRLTYGKVLDYYPRDAVYYKHYTTIDGIIEKEEPTNDEFIVPEKLKELYKAKDYGDYGEDGTLKVCFITNNDITGGNSGSPVINGKGELIGCAFDGNWEAMSGDIAFEHRLQRTIVADIRYILFIIDKYAEATNLIEELDIRSQADASQNE